MLKRLPQRMEEGLAGLCLLVMALLPLGEMAARRLFGIGIPGSGPVVQHLVLWVAFLGAALAAREGKLLAIATGELLSEGRLRTAARVFAVTVAAAVSALLARGCLDFLLIEREAGSTIALDIPLWVAILPLPVAFAAIGLRLVWRAGEGWWPRGLAAAGLAAGLWLGQAPELLEGAPVLPGLTLLVAATLLGSPIFAAIGGAAVFLFLVDGIPAAAVPVETYRLVVSPTLAAIPLFTLAGFLFAEGDAAKRLVRVFRGLFGWIPGGTAVVAVLVCAFFTTFTGGSGVTILALGALLFQALRAEGYRDSFSVGMLTSGGSLGLLLPPALPLILYGIVAEVSIEDLFIGGLVPGLLLIGLTAAWAVREGLIVKGARTPFAAREALAAVWAGKWELALPVLVLVAIFGGFATLVEAAALAAGYAFVVQCFVQREIRVGGHLFRVLTQCVVLLGGVLVILGVAMGLTSYLVDAQIPAHLLAWAQDHIHSPLIFLLYLNLFLLIVGCLMDIFSATVVVAPLVIPLGVAFGVDPIHLGIIFIANLELGYMTPPVGLNLFLASYRFEKPLLEVWKAVLPLLGLRAIGVALITYVPFLTLGLLRALGRI